MTNLVFFYSIFVLVTHSRLCVGFEYFLSNISGEVEKGNFKYYSLSQEGTILLELTSLSGDCDLYVSQNKKNPSYEPHSNCLQSVTCGIDSIIVPKSFKRPVGVGVFGHPSHEVCAFNLIIFKIHDSRDIFNYDPYDQSLEAEMNKNMNAEGIDLEAMDFMASDQEEESFFWVLLRSIVVFLIEIIL